ncbi:spore cortex lytic enzyme [Neobacillus bataviensis LMG 21833]|uniref:Spore cortex lytic enzyme n=1 Tax=Neobacillus bataviensis LMG 21833 TaxID=1117379 RepID=K6BTT4_9BACI|nr:glycoside hydrolase family 18 protein [Neobacillus bataviensis]EKN62360.1 spore cortex lytic enzyme [Neobacillus bataviensis LMG 21833]
MFFHEVKARDSLFTIGSRYGISIDEIRRVNGLEKTNIVPGQALLIPLYTYIVQPGDTLTGIARKSFLSIKQLTDANPAVNPAALRPGMRLTIPTISNFHASVLSFYVIRSPELDRALISDDAPYCTAISIFEYHFASNGDIANTLNDLTAIQTTWSHRVRPLVTVTNLTPEGFSSALVHQVLNNPTARTNLVNNISYLVTNRGYGGVNIDFERVMAEDRDLFTGFLRDLRDRLQPLGRTLTIALPAKTSQEIPWLRGYDYGGIGSVVDFMFIMAYDWHHAGSEPGPAAPITEVRRTVEFAIQYVPRRKVIIGMPLYGYDWTIPYSPGRVAPAISNQDAVETAMRYQSPIQYSTEFESPFFHYTDQKGLKHEVWFEDVRSMGAKMLLIRDYGLQGLGAWQLTLGFTQGPWLLTKFFTIIKV